MLQPVSDKLAIWIGLLFARGLKDDIVGLQLADEDFHIFFVQKERLAALFVGEQGLEKDVRRRLIFFRNSFLQRSQLHGRILRADAAGNVAQPQLLEGDRVVEAGGAVRHLPCPRRLFRHTHDVPEDLVDCGVLRPCPASGTGFQQGLLLIGEVLTGDRHGGGDAGPDYEDRSHLTFLSGLMPKIGATENLPKQIRQITIQPAEGALNSHLPIKPYPNLASYWTALCGDGENAGPRSGDRKPLRFCKSRLMMYPT